MGEELHGPHVVSDFQFDALICFTVVDSKNAQVNGMRGDGGVLGLKVSVCGDESVNLARAVEKWSQGGRTCEWPRVSGKELAVRLTPRSRRSLHGDRSIRVRKQRAQLDANRTAKEGGNKPKPAM